MDAPVWVAPDSPGPVRGTVEVPGSKSQTNRALVLSALADGTSVLRAPLRARDTELMVAGLRSLGVNVLDRGTDWVVAGAPELRADRGLARIDCGLAGTVARFLLPCACLAAGQTLLDGDPRMRERPMAPLVSALQGLGARVDDGGRGRLPVRVEGHPHARGGSVVLDSSTSSQFISALLLSAPRWAGGLRVSHAGPPLPSAPHVAMTLAELAARGVRVETPAPNTWSVAPGVIHALDAEIEADASGALPFLAAAVVTAGQVRLARWPLQTCQPGGAFPALLAAFGARSQLLPDALVIDGPDRITGADLDLRDYSEALPVLAALALFADRPSRLRNVAHVRGHEVDRLATLAAEFARLGARVAVTADGLAITPVPLHAAVLDPHADHRLAMAFAVVGLLVPGVGVRDVGTTAKTFPDFVQRWRTLVASPAARPGPADQPAARPGPADQPCPPAAERAGEGPTTG